MEQIREHLFDLQDLKYAQFHRKLIPTVDAERVIGVRTPELRRYAKELSKTDEAKAFLQELPHYWYEENQLHAFIISAMKDFNECIEHVNLFLPYVDNWATCDQLLPISFKKHHQELLSYIHDWLKSSHTYTVRFAIGCLMNHFLDEDFSVDYPSVVAKVSVDDYYVRMMQAWYFATALAKQYPAVLPFIQNRNLEPWTHRMSIQKAVESRRLTDEQKNELRSLRHDH